jgi:hypothetical protein
MFGGLRVVSAEIMDIPTSKISWRLYLPSQYSYPYMQGSMDPRRGSFSFLKRINPAIASQDVQRQSTISMNQKNILRQQDEKALYGLDVDIVREGTMYTLAKLDKGAYLNVRHIKKSVLFNVSLLLVALVAGIFAYIPIVKKFDKIRFVLISIVGALLVVILAPQAIKYFAFLLLLGIGISGLVLLGLHFSGRFRSRKVSMNVDT